MIQLGRIAIDVLTQANEMRLLKAISGRLYSISPIPMNGLRIEADEAVKWLRLSNKQKLLQILAKSESPMMLPDLEELDKQTRVAGQNLAYAQGTRILASLTHEPPLLQMPDMVIFEHEATIATRSLQQANEFRIFQELRRRPVNFGLPSLETLESICHTVGTLLKEVDSVRLAQKLVHHGIPFGLPEMSAFTAEARNLSSRLRITQEAKILAGLWKREQKRVKVIQQCFLHAEWAGSDLQKWDRVFVEYEKYPKSMKILNKLIEEAHSLFLGIMVETRNMREIEKACAGKPFLMREYSLLNEQLQIYYSKSVASIKESYKAPMDREKIGQTEPENGMDNHAIFMP